MALSSFLDLRFKADVNIVLSRRAFAWLADGKLTSFPQWEVGEFLGGEQLGFNPVTAVPARSDSPVPMPLWSAARLLVQLG